MRKDIDRGLSLSSKKRKFKRKMVEMKTSLEERSNPTKTTGKNTPRLNVKKVELKTCLTPHIREDFVKMTEMTGKFKVNTLASIES